MGLLMKMLLKPNVRDWNCIFFPVAYQNICYIQLKGKHEKRIFGVKAISNCRSLLISNVKLITDM